jgi:type IV pilus assembly protein PilV
MATRHPLPRGQGGVMLLEALIGILIFSVGILAMVAMQGMAVGYVSDAKYRSDAGFLADEILSHMWVDRTNLVNYRCCTPVGTSPNLAPWIVKVNNALPGSAIAGNEPAISVDTTTGTVDVTIRWQLPSGESVRNYRVIAVVSNP